MSCYKKHLFWHRSCRNRERRWRMAAVDRLAAVCLFARWHVIMCLTVVCFAALCSAVGCGLTATEEETDAVKEKIDFTVLRQSEIPEELAANIETRKEDPFKIAYTDQGYTYIAIGYGSQPTGGYSIMVEECYITETNLCVKTKFLGPETNRDLVQTITYPYIVIKVENRGLDVTYLE